MVAPMRCWSAPIALAVAVLAVPIDAVPPDRTAQFAALRTIDLRLATIAYRLTTANAALCRELAPTPGWAIQSLDQFAPAARGVARRIFGFERPIAVEAVVAGAPADRAGVKANDALATVNGSPFPAEDPGLSAGSSVTRDAALALVAAQPADEPLVVRTVRDGVARPVTIAATAGCRSAFELLPTPGLNAASDGTAVQIGAGFFDRYADDQVAAVVAHELAHTILHHRQRLDAAKVDRGLSAQLGRSGRLFRATEGDADLLSVALLYNAGYDPQAAVRFWRAHGGDVDGGLLRSRTHPSPGARAAAIAAEIARMPPGAPRPYVPPVLATRDEPLK